MQILPLSNDYAQIFSTVLNGQEVSVRVWYQDIGTGWFFSMTFEDGRHIVNGFRINTGAPILTVVVSDFIGNLVCVPTIEKTAEPLKDAPWGNTHSLIYLTPEESKEAGLE